jgi:GntR family transcriptional repressor for pyruvate dehydrogenase complex
VARHYQDVMRELVDAIVGGDYAEGEWLPNVDELRERLGASRGVVREALRALEERGLIAVHPGRGQSVRAREDWDLRAPAVLRAWIERGPDSSLLAETIDARSLIERAAAAIVCETAPEADLELLRSRLDQMRWAARAGEPFVAAEVEFHRTLLTLSRNRMLANVIEPAHVVLAQLRMARAPARTAAVVAHHGRILEGVLSREPALADSAIAGYADHLAGWLGARRR